MRATPLQARDRKRLPARVVLNWGPGTSVVVPKPSLGAWLYLAQEAGATTGMVRRFQCERADVTVTLGGKR